MQRTTERVKFLSQCDDRLGRITYGLFEVLIDTEELRRQMMRAVQNKGKESWDGALGVIYRPATKEQAEFVIEQERKK
jgi:hypothetical protein